MAKGARVLEGNIRSKQTQRLLWDMGSVNAKRPTASRSNVKQGAEKTRELIAQTRLEENFYATSERLEVSAATKKDPLSQRYSTSKVPLEDGIMTGESRGGLYNPRDRESLPGGGDRGSTT